MGTRSWSSLLFLSAGASLEVQGTLHHPFSASSSWQNAPLLRLSRPSLTEGAPEEWAGDQATRRPRYQHSPRAECLAGRATGVPANCQGNTESAQRRRC